MNNKKRPIVAVIGLAIFIALLYLLFAGGNTSDAPTEPQEKKATTRSGIPNLGGRSEAELLTDCQIDIQNKLSNPRSMDIVYSDLKYKKEPNHELWFQFYAILEGCLSFYSAHKKTPSIKIGFKSISHSWLLIKTFVYV